MAPDRAPGSVTVGVAGGDAVVGHALELLLRSSHFTVKFLSELHLSKPEPLDGIQLLLLAPGLDAERREALLTLVERASATRKTPILELVADSERVRDRPEHLTVSWPCRMEELKRRVKDAMLAEQVNEAARQDAQTREVKEDGT